MSEETKDDITKRVTGNEREDEFIRPETRELVEAGAVGAGDEEGAGIEARDLDDAASLWRTLEQMPTDRVLEEVARRFEDAPDRRRQVLALQMARELGYSRVWRRRSALTREPLWDVLSAPNFDQLSEQGRRALAMIGRSVQPRRTSLHPSAALATLAIWRHTDDRDRYREAANRLRDRALPNEPEWLYEVVDVFITDSKDATSGRELDELVEWMLANSYWEVAALLSGLMLVHRYGKWYHSAVVSNLIYACDVASQQVPQQARKWIEYLADAAMGGRLTFSWLEEPVRAAIRLNIDDAQREAKLRDYLETRPFDVDHRRLETIYGPVLEQLERCDSETARQRLFSEVKSTVRANPTRAIRLLETMALHEHGGRVGFHGFRLRQTLSQMGDDPSLDRLESWLVGLYVHSATLEPHAVDLVHRAGDDVDWDRNPFASGDDYQLYRVISDYERAIEELTCKFDGVTMEHADKHAAARVKFFVEKRVDPGRLQKLVQRLFSPVMWMSSELTELGLVREAIDRGMKRFERRVQRQHLGGDVVDAFNEAGVGVDEFDDIASLPVDRIEEVLERLRRRRLLLGAVAGGLSGGLAPFGWGVLSLADIPVVLSITADVCSRFCWYFGFDPRQHPELPLEILAVALGGTEPAAIEPMLVRHNLHDQVLQNSLVVGALTRGGMTHLTGKGLSKALQQQMGTSLARRAGGFARRAVSRNLKRRAVQSRPPRALPVVGALLGAALNTALIYDICEAAQAVLTDRFLERKYPEWARHIGTTDQAAE